MNSDIIGTQCSECCYIVTREDFKDYQRKDPENIFRWKCPSCGNSEAEEVMKKWDKLYIQPHIPGLHTYGLVLESKNEQLNRKFVSLCNRYLIGEPNVIWKLHPFHQCGSHDLNCGYQYFEFLGAINLTDEKYNLMFDLCFKIAEELGLELTL